MPQVQTDPSDSSARLCWYPAEMEVAELSLPLPWSPVTQSTPRGELNPPSPSSPELFRPQAQTSPAVVSARLCPGPAATSFMKKQPLGKYAGATAFAYGLI